MALARLGHNPWHWPDRAGAQAQPRRTDRSGLSTDGGLPQHRLRLPAGTTSAAPQIMARRGRVKATDAPHSARPLQVRRDVLRVRQPVRHRRADEFPRARRNDHRVDRRQPVPLRVRTPPRRCTPALQVFMSEYGSRRYQSLSGSVLRRRQHCCVVCNVTATSRRSTSFWPSRKC